jgi:hypothetical protein
MNTCEYIHIYIYACMHLKIHTFFLIDTHMLIAYLNIHALFETYDHKEAWFQR